MNLVKRFLTTNKVSTHTIAAFLIFWVTAYTQIPQFHDWVMQTYQSLPKGWQNFLGSAVALAILYWRGHKSVAQLTVGQNDAIDKAADKLAVELNKPPISPAEGAPPSS